MFKRFKNWFYAGPQDLGLRLKGRGGYQSPTVTAGAWILAFAVRHLTLPGRFTALCCLLLVPYSLVTTAMPIYMLGFAVFMLFLFDIAIGLLFRPRVEIHRSYPARVAEGAEMAVSYSIRNVRRFSAWNLLVDTLPFPGTVDIVEGGEQIRRLAGLKEATTAAKWQAKRRGEHTIPSARCVSAFPFGLWSWGRTSGAAEVLLVYPRFTPLDNVSLNIGEKYQPEGESVSAKAGLSMEFLGCREFRDGDDLRRLHMRSWARAGYPVVKEFRQEYMARTGIVLDTFQPRRIFEEVRRRFRARDEFEAVVSLSAALVDYFAGHDSRVDLFAAGTEVHHFGGSHGIEYLDHVLDILAAVDYSNRDDFRELGEKLTPYAMLTSGIVFVLGQWDEDREAVIRETMASGVQCRAVLVTPDGTARRRRPVPDFVTEVTTEDVLQGRCVRL